MTFSSGEKAFPCPVSGRLLTWKTAFASRPGVPIPPKNPK